MNIKSQITHFYREIKSIEIFPATSISGYDYFSFNGVLENPMATISNILPSNYDESVKIKSHSNNEYHNISINLDLDFSDLRESEEISKILGKRRFLVKINTNLDSLILGNSMEPLTIELQNHFKNNNSGENHFTLSIYGTTIFKPIYQIK